MAEDSRPEEVQRWTAKRRAALMISLLKGEITAAEAARRNTGRRSPRLKGGAIAFCAGLRMRFVLTRRRTRRCAKKKSIGSSERWAN